MTEEYPDTPILFLAPQAGREYILAQTGQSLNLGLAKTLLNAGENTIIINSTLPDEIQAVLIEHERVQLGVILNWISSGRQIEAILAKAHDIGLAAGMELAEQLGVLEDYLALRE